jgi:hypothetical protein
MKRTQDTTPRTRPTRPLRDASAEDLPSTEVNEAPTTGAQTDALATSAPLTALEEIKRKYGPDILRPASLLPRKTAKRTAAELKAAEHRSSKQS